MAMAGTAGSPAGGLSFKSMTNYGWGKGIDLDFSSADREATVFLCVGKEENRVKVSETTRLSRQAEVLAAIDAFETWGTLIDLWMVAEKGGAESARTGKVKYRSHVRPYFGELKISDIAADVPALTYPGNGFGRVLTPMLNDRYYFHLGGVFETENAKRGFDCTTFPMALFSLRHLPPPGYGKQLCTALGAAPCGIEQVGRAALHQRFVDDDVPNGYYVLFSAGHVMLYDSWKNTLYEFNLGGFRQMPAAQAALQAPQGIWWMRKLGEDKGPFFL